MCMRGLKFEATAGGGGGVAENELEHKRGFLDCAFIVYFFFTVVWRPLCIQQRSTVFACVGSTGLRAVS